VAAEIRESAQPLPAFVAYDQDRGAYRLDRAVLAGIGPLVDTPTMIQPRAWMFSTSALKNDSDV